MRLKCNGSTAIEKIAQDSHGVAGGRMIFRLIPRATECHRQSCFRNRKNSRDERLIRPSRRQSSHRYGLGGYVMNRASKYSSCLEGAASATGRIDNACKTDQQTSSAVLSKRENHFW